MPTPEGAILKSIMEYLAARRIFAVRMNSGTQIGSHRGKKWAIHMNAPGTADVLAFAECKRVENVPFDQKGYLKVTLEEIVPLWIECKAPKGKQSDLQKSFQQQVESHGHRYIIARSIEDVEAALP